MIHEKTKVFRCVTNQAWNFLVLLVEDHKQVDPDC